MIAVSTPMMDRTIPAVAIRLLSERLPKNPKTIPAIPKIVPATGMSPTHKLKTPNAADISA